MFDKWDIRFINLAKEISSWSKDPSRQIGAVIVNQNKHVVGMGYNGFPSGIADKEKRLKNKELKRAISLHAEESAILNAKCDLDNCKIYVYGLPCCSHCASMIIQSGIKEVYYQLSEKGESEHWKQNTDLAKSLFKEAKVKVKELKS